MLEGLWMSTWLDRDGKERKLPDSGRMVVNMAVWENAAEKTG
jgi:hypothetical protein